jgi:hypothetical protein
MWPQCEVIYSIKSTAIQTAKSRTKLSIIIFRNISKQTTKAVLRKHSQVKARHQHYHTNMHQVTFQANNTLTFSDVRVSQQWLWRSLPSGMWHCAVWYKPAIVLEEGIGSMFRVEENSVFKMEVASPSKMSVKIYQTIWCHTPQESKIHSHRDSLPKNHCFYCNLFDSNKRQCIPVAHTCVLLKLEAHEGGWLVCKEYPLVRWWGSKCSHPQKFCKRKMLIK